MFSPGCLSCTNSSTESVALALLLFRGERWSRNGVLAKPHPTQSHTFKPIEIIKTQTAGIFEIWNIFETYIWNIVKGGEMCEVSIRLVTSHSLGLHVHATPERNWYLWLQWVPWRTSHGLWGEHGEHHRCAVPRVLFYIVLIGSALVQRRSEKLPIRRTCSEPLHFLEPFHLQCATPFQY